MANFTDDFNRGTSNALGSSWTESESDATACRLLTDRLRLTNSNTIKGLALWDVATGNDQFIEIEYRGLDTGTASFGTLCVRGSGTHDNFTGYGFLIDDGASKDVRLYKFVNEPVDITGAKTPITVINRSIAVGDVVRLEARGDRVICYFKREVVIDHSDPGGIASGKVGMISPKIATSGTWSGLWDNARGGDVFAAGTGQFTDNFNRADNDSLGSSWSEQENPATTFRVQSNRLRTVVQNQSGGFAIYDQSYSADQFAEIVYRGAETATVPGTFAGPAVRLSGTHSAGFGYFVVVDDGSTPDLRLYKFANQNVRLPDGTLLATDNYVVKIDDLIRIEAEGTTIRVLVNGDQKISVTDSAIASGKAGMGAPKFGDNFTLTGRWDNWAGGSLSLQASTSDALSFADAGADGYRALGGEPVDALGFVDGGVAGELTPISQEGVSDALGFVDAGIEGALFNSLAGAVSDALSFAESADGAQAVRTGPGITVLARLGLAEGDEYVSDIDVRHPSRFYDGRAQFGTIRRGAELPANLPQVADASMRLSDTDRRYRAKFGARSPRGREVDLRLLPEGEREIASQQVFRGEVSRVRFPEGEVEVSASDRLFAFLDETIPALGTKAHFPNLPGDQEQFVPIIYGDVIGTEGLIECPRVDTLKYAASRYRLESIDEVRIRNEGDEEFSVTTQYAVSEQTITEGGIDYPVQIITLFGSGTGPATKVRIQARGVVDSAGDAERNPSRVLKSYLVNVAGRSETILDLTAFEESATRASNAGYFADFAIVNPITHREAVSRITTSFNLMVFGNRWGQISCKLPTVDEPAPLEVGELLTGKLSVVVDLPDPPFNRFRYRFGRNYGAGDWATEQVYDNDPSQAVLGKTYEQTVDLWAVREAATASSVVSDISSYHDPGAYRVTLDLPAPEVISEIEIGSQISLTHYSGVDPSGTGWAGRLFRVTDLELSFDRENYLRLRVGAVTKVQPPAEPVQALLDVDWAENSITGPYQFGGGLFYGIFRDGSNQKLMNAHRSIDWGRNWSKIAGPTQANNIVSFDSYRSGSKIHVLTQESDGRVAYHRFDMVTNAWDVTDELIQGAVASVPTKFFTSICTRRSNDQPIAFFAGGLETFDSVQRERQFYSRKDTGGWTSPAQVGSGGSYDYRGGRVIPGKSDLIHFFFERSPGDFTAATPDAYHQTLSGNTLRSSIRWQLTSLIWLPTTHNVGQYTTFEQTNGEVLIYVPVKGYGGDASVYRFGSKQDLESQALVVVSLRAESSIPYQGESTLDGSTRYPHISLGASSDGTIHAAWTAFVGLLADKWEVYKRQSVPGGNVWTPPEGGFGCSNSLGNRCSMEHRLGALIPYPQTVPKMNALFFELGGDVWCGRFTYTQFTTAQKIQLGILPKTPTVFELLNIDRDVPRAASWTLQALADALTE